MTAAEKIVSYKIQRTIQKDDLPEFDAVAEITGAAMDVAEGPEGGEDYYVVTYFVDADAPKESFLKALGQADLKAGTADQGQEMGPVFDQDWEATTVNSFQPIEVGPYFIYRFDEIPPQDKVGLKIPANMAFGSGEHATTSGCLELLEQLTPNHSFTQGLDMGAGSGILAIAAAKRHNIPMLAVDIDRPSVLACEENARDNGVFNQVYCACGDGFNTPEVTKNAPYDLIFANILAQPLIEMAGAFPPVLAEKGVVILSGFLTHQEDDVRAAYAGVGLGVECGRVVRDNWVALALKA